MKEVNFKKNGGKEMIERVTREGTKELFTDDVDGYGIPKKIITKLNAIFDYVESLESQVTRISRAKKVTRAETKAFWKDDADTFGKPRKLMDKIDVIFDYIEYLEKRIRKASKTRKNESMLRRFL